MPRPGVTIINREAPPAAGPPIQTGTAFIVGPAERGAPNAATKVTSIADFERLLGERQSYSYLYDAVDVFFRMGGGSAYISRVASTGIQAAGADLDDASKATIHVDAISPGAWANNYTVTLTTTGGLTLTVKDADGNQLEQVTAADKAGLLASTAFEYVALTDADPTAGEPVAVSNVALTGGDDDAANITTTSWSDALAGLPRGLGPGQVFAPGQTDATIQGAVVQHAVDHNRVALLDTPDTQSLSEIEAAATAARGLGNSDYASIWAPWVLVPGTLAQTARRVPYSAAQAGLEAARDRISSPNVPAAGRDFPLDYVIDFTRAFTDGEREELLDYGVNTGRLVYAIPETYGYRSLSTDPNWLQFNHSRLRMAITAEGEQVGEMFVFDEIDGRGLKIAQFGSSIAGMLLGFFNDGSLYGLTPRDAFRVDTGSAVNTPESLANGELHAVAGVRMSPFAEEVIIEFVQTPITQAV